MSPQILTVGGNIFSFVDPENSTYTIEDIAHSISHIARFTGHTLTFYSVAQHCAIGSYHVAPENALAFLLHDASEAFCGDVSTPLKMLIKDVYKPIEERVERAIMKKFGVPFPLVPDIKRVDTIMLHTEFRDLMPSGACMEGVETLEERIWPVPPKQAKQMFLDRYYELTGA